MIKRKGVFPVNNEFAPDIITLIDEENKEHSFEILDTLVYEDDEYYALYPIFDEAEQAVQDSGEYYIMHVVDGEDGEQELAEIDDDDLLDRLAEIFEAHFEEMFSDEEEE